ncbi:hypothetical protein WCD74_03050 [Actinomycetospora sp. OC33-EN08]|uniref:EcsC family protein n=1 Tax=Actinomycetospora aurantiaca TaxID=3129233 RepID=A0ABU8MHD2_9PSEU
MTIDEARDEPTPDDEQQTGRALRLLDRAIDLQQPLVAAHVRKLRERHPEESASEICKRLERQYLAAVTGSGAAVGAAAAAPGVGTAASLAMSAGETVTSLEAAALFALSYAEVHGVHIADVERRRTLLLSLLLGDGGSTFVSKAAGRTGKHWGRLLVDAIPMTKINQVNRVLGGRFITKYGQKQGILVLGRTAPFGIGAGIGAAGNAAVGWTVVKGVRRAFGDVPEDPGHLKGRHSED